MKYAIYKNNTNKILRIIRGHSAHINSQLKENESFASVSNDVSDMTHKIIGGKAVKKTFEEIESEKQPGIPEGKKPKLITKDMWQAVLNRLTNLDGET